MAGFLRVHAEEVNRGLREALIHCDDVFVELHPETYDDEEETIGEIREILIVRVSRGSFSNWIELKSSSKVIDSGLEVAQGG